MKRSKPNTTSSKPASLPNERLTFKAPIQLCLYDDESREETKNFINAFDRAVFFDLKYVHLDFSETKTITAAAALLLFGKITRCQCCVRREIFKFPHQIITFTLPEHPECRQLIINSGFWEAIKPGGIKKLERLNENWGNPFKTGNNPTKEIPDIISHLQAIVKPLPSKIVAALQEAYLNISHHAYEQLKDPDDPLHSFMIGRWWQYVVLKKNTNKLTVIILDMGAGIPATISATGSAHKSDSSKIDYAMQSGVTRFMLQGRGHGFDNIKSPIDINASAEYLLIHSGKGKVIYKKGKIVEQDNLDWNFGGTLIEWVFGGIK